MLGQEIEPSSAALPAAIDDDRGTSPVKSRLTFPQLQLQNSRWKELAHRRLDELIAESEKARSYGTLTIALETKAGAIVSVCRKQESTDRGNGPMG